MVVWNPLKIMISW